MSVEPRYPADVVAVLAILDEVCRSLARVIERLTDARATAAGLTSATDWQAAAARAFHARTEGWQRDVSALCDTGEYLCEEVGRMRARAVEAAWRAAA